MENKIIYKLQTYKQKNKKQKCQLVLNLDKEIIFKLKIY